MGAILKNNLEAVYFIYGLAFFTMGIVIFSHTVSKSKFRLAGILGFLGWFGLIHGINEWLDNLAIIKGRSDFLDSVRLFVLSISFVFLFEFGRQFFRLERQKYPAGLKKFADLLTGATTLIAITTICIISVFNQGLLKTWSAWTRYLLAFPGGVLSGIGFFLYYKYEEAALAPFKVKKYFLAAGISFLAYAILAGLIVNKSRGGVLTFLNDEYFFSIIAIPTQVFRALCAITIGWSIISILGIFRSEIIKNLEEINNRKSDFVANVSHEFKNPLTAIKESLAIVTEGLAGEINAEQKSILEAGKQSTERLIRLVTDLLDLAKIESGKTNMRKEQFEMGLLITEILNNYANEISKKQLTLKINIEQGIGPIQADRDKISQVIINLLNNAIKYTPGGGSITVQLAKGPDKDMRFEISDTGPGVAKEYFGKIFDKFERVAAEKYEGTGLGLSIVKGIVELHKGKIWIESEIGKGSKLIFILPKTQG